MHVLGKLSAEKGLPCLAHSVCRRMAVCAVMNILSCNMVQQTKLWFLEKHAVSCCTESESAVAYMLLLASM